MNKSNTIPLSISDKAFREGRVLENLVALRTAGFTHLHFSHNWRGTEPLSGAELVNWQRDLEKADVLVLDVHGWHPKGLNLNNCGPRLRILHLNDYCICNCTPKLLRWVNESSAFGPGLLESVPVTSRNG